MQDYEADWKDSSSANRNSNSALYSETEDAKIFWLKKKQK